MCPGKLDSSSMSDPQESWGRGVGRMITTWLTWLPAYAFSHMAHRGTVVIISTDDEMRLREVQWMPKVLKLRNYKDIPTGT